MTLHSPQNKGEPLRPIYKEYSRFPKSALLTPTSIDASISETLLKRRSFRNFTGSTISEQSFSTLAHSVAGLREDSTRTHPSGGSLYPLEYYWSIGNVEGIESGLYHYHIPSHSLEKLSKNTISLTNTLTYEWSKGASAFLIVTILWDRITPHYGEKSYELALLEAGHIMQNTLLATTALGIGSCPLG